MFYGIFFLKDNHFFFGLWTWNFTKIWWHHRRYVVVFFRMLRLIYAWQVDKGETIELEGTSFSPRLFLSLSFFSAIWSAQLTKISYMRTKIIIRPQRQKFITYRTVGEIRPIRSIEKVEHRYKTKQVYHYIFYMIYVTVHIRRFIISIIIQNENIGL